MKKTGICSKCGGDRVVKVNDFGDVQIPLGFVGRTWAQGFICCSCGYLELWAPEDKLEQIYKEYQWNRVPVRKE